MKRSLEAGVDELIPLVGLLINVLLSNALSGGVTTFVLQSFMRRFISLRLPHASSGLDMLQSPRNLLHEVNARNGIVG
jgi:hypothetical protein